jgi:hypothetical protein
MADKKPRYFARLATTDPERLSRISTLGGLRTGTDASAARARAATIAKRTATSDPNGDLPTGRTGPPSRLHPARPHGEDDGRTRGSSCPTPRGQGPRRAQDAPKDPETIDPAGGTPCGIRPSSSGLWISRGIRLPE